MSIDLRRKLIQKMFHHSNAMSCGVFEILDEVKALVEEGGMGNILEVFEFAIDDASDRLTEVSELINDGESNPNQLQLMLNDIFERSFRQEMISMDILQLIIEIRLGATDEFVFRKVDEIKSRVPAISIGLVN